jgi:hypothetical protein
VTQRSAIGDEVQILSPDPRSAAHHTGNLNGVLLPLRLVMMSPRFDALVLRIEPGLPFPEQTNRVVRAIILFGLGIALGTYSEVTLRLDSPIPLPGGVGGRATTDLWRRATTIVVANESDRQRMLSAPGVADERVVIATSVTGASDRVDHLWPQATEDGLRERVLGQIRRRAQAERSANTARVDLGATGVGPLASETFSASTRVVPSGSSLARAAFSRIKREVIGRATKN